MPWHQLEKVDFLARGKGSSERNGFTVGFESSKWMGLGLFQPCGVIGEKGGEVAIQGQSVKQILLPILEAVYGFHLRQAPLLRCAVRRRHNTPCITPARVITAKDALFWFLRTRLKSGFPRRKERLGLNRWLPPRQ